VELLIHHAIWLARADFVEHFVHIDTDATGSIEMAHIDWNAVAAALAAGTLLCSSSEGQMLRRENDGRPGWKFTGTARHPTRHEQMGDRARFQARRLST
jgi:hypothetical protein